VPELAPLKSELNDLAKVQTDAIALLSKTTLQHKHQTELIQQQSNALQQEVMQVKQDYQLLQQATQHHLKSLQQLMKQQSELDEDTFSRALSAQLTWMQLEVSQQSDIGVAVKLTELVASQKNIWQQLLAKHHVVFQLFEGADNVAYELDSSAQQLTSLLMAMLELGSRSKSVSELTLRIHLENADQGGVLHISVTSDGDGISSRVRQLLNSNDVTSLHWQESDIGIFITLKRQLNASMNIQSLDGLGCTIGVTIPVNIARQVNVAAMQHLLLCDPQIGSLTERGQRMVPLAAQISRCANVTELALKTKQQVYDVAIIALPEPSDLVKWRTVLQDLNRRSRLLCYAIPTQIAVWQEALELNVQEAPFFIADLNGVSPQQEPLPRLLVVDDNPTNLAFVQVLLKEQPVQLHTVNCGADALKICQQQLFDVILLDIQLPDIAGTEVARQLRQLSDYQHTPILAFTAHALEEEVSSFKQAGMNDVIFKPLEAAKLGQILHWCSVGKNNNVAQ
jgi:two-component system, NarL family, sensor histidine kinase BarA